MIAEHSKKVIATHLFNFDINVTEPFMPQIGGASGDLVVRLIYKHIVMKNEVQDVIVLHQAFTRHKLEVQPVAMVFHHRQHSMHYY